MTTEIFIAALPNRRPPAPLVPPLSMSLVQQISVNCLSKTDRRFLQIYNARLRIAAKINEELTINLHQFKINSHLNFNIRFVGQIMQILL